MIFWIAVDVIDLDRDITTGGIHLIPSAFPATRSPLLVEKSSNVNTNAR